MPKLISGLIVIKVYRFWFVLKLFTIKTFLRFERERCKLNLFLNIVYAK